MCVVLAMFALASCEEEQIGDDLSRIEGFVKPVVIEDVSLDLYIITGEDTTTNAITTVEDKINAYLKGRNDKKFNTTLDIKFYKSIDEYKAAVSGATNGGIVLLAGSDMVNEYKSKLVNVEPYLSDADLTKKYGFATLNASINSLLLDAARETVNDETTLYYIPNNHVIGTYDYIVINRDFAQDYLNKTDAELKAIKTEADMNSFKDAVSANVAGFLASSMGAAYAGQGIDDLVKFETGKLYSDKDSYEPLEWWCNVVAYPVASAEEAATAGFGILSGTAKPDAAMEIIYLINTDKTLRNYLQYGIEITNYRVVDGVVVPHTTGDNVYSMNILHTGDVFNALYSKTDDYVWTEEAKEYGLLQNKEAVKPQ